MFLLDTIHFTGEMLRETHEELSHSDHAKGFDYRVGDVVYQMRYIGSPEEE